ncbi:TRAP transporter permease [Stappia indica]|uniref:TRAP transporter, 4TM/12TM fusion protein n=1 Tax=Stappia indica TaxID=538381 RepID=A0A285SHQ6_9HYPH|nr:TRAP transporter fused permease subunit [Stappia indica]MCC4245223.1 TRAP transporter fused permease subunit [Stappia indica]SOC06900.1 TRAP transporter, 4TM/12TM fusion protein [Stappia indica]
MIQKVISVTAVAFSAYMIYATLFGPYRTTLVHLAIFLAASFTIYFLEREGRLIKDPLYLRAINWLCVIGTLAATAHIVINLDRILASWGASFLTTGDLVFGGVLVLVVLEAARRESIAFFLLSVIGILYILFGNLLPGVLGHSGMDLRRFIYLTAYTGEGIFGFGLNVAASYLFMFMLLSSAMARTKTGEFIMDMCNAYFGHRVGGPAKSAVVASAGLGTMVGSSIGNVATTGTFTIPLMQKNGLPGYKAGAVETVASEGSQFLPPIMGAGAFIMAEMTGIPYASIALAALLPALLYFVSIFAVVHFEAVKLGLKGLDRSEIPSARQVLHDGWHLLIPPAILFYLLMWEGLTPGYAGMIAVLVSIVVAMLRASSRMSFGQILSVFDRGARSAASVAALIAAVGFIQQAMVTTGLAPRLTEIMLLGTGGEMIWTLVLAVIAATILGMGMPTPIAYVLLALFVAPALETVGVSTLAAHLFLFYFAIKSGSTPPVAMVAIVAASIAKADWWKTGLWSFYYSLPGFIIAFMFVYSPALLFQGTAVEISMAMTMATIGTVGIAGAMLGWCGWPLSILERLALAAGSIFLIHSGLITDAVGLALVLGSVSLARFRASRSVASGISG